MAGLPPLPPGFTLDAPAAPPAGGRKLPPLPPGFTLDGPAPAKGAVPEPNGYWSQDALHSLGGATPVERPLAPPEPPRESLPDVDNGHNWFMNGLLGVGGQFNKDVVGAATFLPRLANKGLAAAGLVDDPNTMDRVDQRMKSAVAPIDVSNTAAGRMGTATAGPVEAGLMLGAIPPVGAVAPISEATPGVASAFLRGIRELAAKPATTGGMIANTEANAASGAIGQTVAEKYGEKYRGLGEMAGAPLPGLMPVTLGSKALSATGMMAGGPLRMAEAMAIPDSKTFASRAAERRSFIGRGVDDYGNKLEAPSGADYSNPATPAPKTSMIEGIQDHATGVRDENAQAHLQRQFRTLFEDPEVQARQKRSEDLKREIPGFNPTLAESTGNEPLLLKQKQIEQNMSGDKLVTRQSAKSASDAAVGKYADSRVPPVGPDADTAVGDTARAIVGERMTRAEADAENATRGIKSVSDTLPSIPQQNTGAEIRKGIQVGQKAENEVVGKNRQAVVDAAGDTRLPTAPLHEGIQSDLADLRTDLTDPVVPKSVRQLLGKTEPQEPTVSKILGPDGNPIKKEPVQDYDIEGLLSAREDVNAALRKAKNNQDGQAQTILGRVKDRLDAEAVRLEKENPDSDVAGKLKAYNTHYKETYAPNYGQGLADRALHKDATGRPKVEDQDITKELVSPNASIEDTRQNLRVNPEGPAREATKNANLDDMRRKVVDPATGMIKQGEIDKYLGANQNRLAEDPEMASLLKSKDPQKLYDALNQAHTEAAAHKDSVLQKQFGETRSDGRRLKEAYDDPKLMAQIKEEAAKDPELDAALKRAVWERVIKNPGEAAANRQGVFNVVFGDNPGHIKDLKTIADAVAISERTNRPKGTPEDFKPPGISALENATGSSAASTLNKLWGVHTGRSSPMYLALDSGLRVLNTFGAQHYERALENAIYNPDTARIIAAGVRNKQLTPMMRTKLGQILMGGGETRMPNQGLTNSVLKSTGSGVSVELTGNKDEDKK